MLTIYRIRAFVWYYWHLAQPLHLRIGPAWALACMQWTRDVDGNLRRFGRTSSW